MAFTKLTVNDGHTADKVDYVSTLVDKPNDVGGLDADELKAVFDKAGMTIQSYLNNTLTEELEASTAAGNIGIASIQGIVATTVQGALEALANAVISQIVPDGSVTTAKLASLAVTEGKLADNSVTAQKIVDGSVTTTELGSSAVTTDKINNGAVSTDKLAAASVTKAKLASMAVGTGNLDTSDLLVPVSCGGTGASTADGAVAAIGAQKAIQSSSFSLTANGWTARSGGGFTQEATVSGMTANAAFVASPSTEAAWKEAADKELYPPTAGANKLTFTCAKQPVNPITVTVYFW